MHHLLFYPQQEVLPFIVAMTFIGPLLGWMVAVSSWKVQQKITLCSLLGVAQLTGCAFLLMTTYQGTLGSHAWTWFTIAPQQRIQLAINIDFLSTLMLSTILALYWIVQLYAIPYFDQYSRRAKQRYFVCASLCVIAACWSVITNHLWGIAIGWEVMSAISSLLIGFQYCQPSAANAGVQAWLTSRIGSLALLGGIFIIMDKIGKDDLSIFTSLTISDISSPAIKLSAFLLLLSGLSKAAQFPFFNWLARATEAPAPASALLHAATVVSMGIYLLLRIAPWLSIHYADPLVIIGHLTSCMGACAALYQSDLKRMLAYSTISHAGYVLASLGVNTMGAGLVYWILHALAKVCLFLCADCVMRNASDHPRFNKWNDISWLKISYFISIIVLIGLPGLSSFRAKEIVLTHTLLWSITQATNGNYILAYVVPTMACISVFATAKYLARSFLWLFFRKAPGHLALEIPSSTNGWMNISIVMLTILTSILSVIPIQGAITDSLFINPYANGSDIPFSKLADTLQPYLLYGSLLLTCLAIITLMAKQKRSQQHILHKVARLLTHGWYIENFINGLRKRIYRCSQWAYAIEQSIFHAGIARLSHGYLYLTQGIVHLEKHLQKRIYDMGRSYLLLAHRIAWVDRYLIAGMGYAISTLFTYGSKVYLSFQKRNIQQQMMWSFVLCCLFFIWAIYNLIAHFT